MSNQVISQVQAKDLKGSFDRIKDANIDFVEDFYAALFKNAPHLYHLFPDEMEEQAQKLNEVLETVVRTIEYPERLIAPVTTLAKRHVGYGVEKEHYDLVKSTMIQTMVDKTPGGLSDSEVEAWEAALGVLTAMMIAQAYGPSN